MHGSSSYLLACELALGVGRLEEAEEGGERGQGGLSAVEV